MNVNISWYENSRIIPGNIFLKLCFELLNILKNMPANIFN